MLPGGTPSGQRRAVTAEGTGVVTVGAGAGTGKTWVLSNRYARLLLTDPSLLPRDILTLTYTEAAANEMKARIEARLRQLLSSPGVPISAARRRAISDGLGEAWISTIHAFTARLIRESGLSLDIDPRAMLISRPQEEEFWTSLGDGAERANLSILADAYGGSALRRAAKHLDADPLLGAAVARWKGRGLSTLAKETAELHASMGHTWQQMMGWAEEALQEESPQVQAARDAVTEILRGPWRQAWDTWAEVFRALGDGFGRKGGRGPSATDLRIMEFFGRWGAALTGEEPDELLLRAFYRDVLGLKGGSTALTGRIKELLGVTVGEWQKGQDKWRGPSTSDGPLAEGERELRAVLLRFCAAAWGLWDAVKRRRGLLSFSDMILYAREALDQDGMDRKFRHILVDEFQDTDPLQFAMIEALSSPHGEELRTSLFAVGDPKQSIYRFRHAEPALFAELVHRAGALGQVELDVSFRTRPSLLERVNGLFSFLWRDGLGSSGAMAQLGYKPLSTPEGADPRRDTGTLPPFSALLIQGDGLKLEDARASLARGVARRIAAWVGEGRTVWDKEAQALRPVRFGDFTLLARKRTSYSLLEQAFAAEGVPAMQDASREYFGRGEVTDIICLLRAAADPEDDEAVAGWLLSPFSGASEEEALRCLQQAPSGRLWTSLAEGNVAQRLRRLHQIGHIKGAEGLLALFDQDRRWLRRYPERERLRALRNLRHALSIAGEFQRDGASGLAACADWMDDALRRDILMEEPAWRGRGEDAVLLSTIHASKGLEYSVVILFDTVGRGGAKSGLRPSRMLGVVFPELPDEVQGEDDEPPQTAGWERLLSEQGEQEEETRLLYVATTRAQDSLILCGLMRATPEGGVAPVQGSWTEQVIGHLIERGECEGDFTGPNITWVDPGTAGGGLPQIAPFPSPRRTARPDQGEVSLAELSATSFALFEWCPLAWRRRYRQGLNLRWESPSHALLTQDDPGGADLGSLAHWLLARWPGADGRADPAELDRWLEGPGTLALLPSYLRELWRREGTKETLRGWLLTFAASEAGKTLLNALRNGAQREARFRMRLGGVTLVGAMDVVVREASLWRVMDYKITPATLLEEAPLELYTSQLDFYALVVREAARLRGEPCKAVRVGLILLREGGQIEERELRDGWEALEARVMDAARRGAAGDCPPSKGRCPLCPWREGCPQRFN